MERSCEINVVDFGSLRALVSVTIGGMEIRGFKVIETEKDGAWVAPPQREVIRDGRKEWFEIVRFKDKDARREFQEWILAEYRKERGKP